MAEHNPARAELNVAHLQLEHFDSATALRLSQAFGDKTQVDELLRLLFTQLRALCRASGLSYTYPSLALDYNFGQQHRHTAEYNLHYRDQPLGTLTLYYALAQHQHEIETAEDLLSLALVPLRNAVTIAAYQGEAQSHPYSNIHPLPVNSRAKSPQLSSAEEIALAEVAAISDGEQKADALVLVALDNYAGILQRDGEEWAHIIMTSVHQQVSDGLRSADGVYHIGNDQIAVLLPHTTLGQAKQVAEKIRVLIASLHLRGNNVEDQLTACMGVANAVQGLSAEQVMANARTALADAQTAGANQINVFNSG